MANAEEIATKLFTTHRSYLMKVALRNCGARWAEDALHDAYLLFVEHYDPTDGSPPLAWLTLTLKRRCWEIYKRERKLEAYSPAGENPAALTVEERASSARDPQEEVEIAETIRERVAVLKGLKAAERDALIDLGLGFGYKEIMKRRGWTYTKVNRCIAEGRSALRAATED